MKQMYLSLFMESVKINHVLGFRWTENSKSMFFLFFFLLQNSLFMNVKIHLLKPLYSL